MEALEAQIGEGRLLPATGRALGIKPRQHASPWITQQAVALATCVPIHEVAFLLGGFLKQTTDHRTFYCWVQLTSAKTMSEDDEQEAEVFEHGEVPSQDSRWWEIVLAEVDGTLLRAQREGA
ncbi:MAG: hypothetical protein ACC700_17410 [Anaerolineales bacterium]